MDFFNSFFQNVKDKLTNPFFGTLGFILIFHHWEFWYTLFNFDKDCTRSEKLAILRAMATKEFSFYDIAEDIGWTVLFVLIGYLVVFLTRALSLAFDHKIMTWLTRKVVSKKVILLETHKTVVTERDRYSEQYEEQRQRVRNFSANLDQQTKQIQEKDTLILLEGEKVNKLNEKNTLLQSDLAESNRKLEQLKSENTNQDDKISVLEDQNEKISVYVGRLEAETFMFRNMFHSTESKKDWNAADKFPTIVKAKVKEIKDLAQFNNYINFYYTIKNGGSLVSGMIETFENFNLVKKIDGDIKLTPLGEIIGFHSDVFRD